MASSVYVHHHLHTPEMTLTLRCTPSTTSLAVLIAAEELRLPYQLEVIEHSTWRIGSPGEETALADGNLTLNRTPPILAYLASLRPEASLMAAVGDEFARTLEWFDWLSCGVHALALGAIRRPGDFSHYTSHHEKIRAKGRVNLLAAFGEIEKSSPKKAGQCFQSILL